MGQGSMSFTITLVIVILTGLISYQSFNKRALYENLLHYPYAEKRSKEYYRMLSSGFIHKDWMHLIINMYVLYMFGEVVEKSFDYLYGELFGKIMYVLMYLLCIVFASFPSYFKNRDNPSYRALGASGAVSGILLIYVVLFPLNKLTFLFFPFIPIPAIVVGLGYLIYSSWANKNRYDNVGHDAHLYGALFGILFLAVTRPQVLLACYQQIVQAIF